MEGFGVLEFATWRTALRNRFIRGQFMLDICCKGSKFVLDEATKILDLFGGAASLP